MTRLGKILIVIISATLKGAMIIILILLIVALCGNILIRLGKVELKYYIWSLGLFKSAPLVIILAKAAYIESFLEYTN